MCIFQTTYHRPCTHQSPLKTKMCTRILDELKRIYEPASLADETIIPFENHLACEPRVGVNIEWTVIDRICGDCERRAGDRSHGPESSWGGTGGGSAMGHWGQHGRGAGAGAGASASGGMGSSGGSSGTMSPLWGAGGGYVSRSSGPGTPGSEQR